MLRTRLFALITAGILAVLTTGCLLSVEPETAENPVGTEHTVIATLLDPESIDEEAFCENLIDALEGIDPEDIEEDEEFILLLILAELCQPESEQTFPSVGPADHNPINFEILSGPNAGLNSDEDGACEPLCSGPAEDFEYSWTYQSNGVAGTDVIEVCVGVVPPDDSLPIESGLVEELLLDVINETLGGDYYDSIEDFFCQTVEKTWVEPTPEPEDTAEPSRPVRPNIGAGLSGLFAGQPTALPTAVAPAPAAPSPTIRPPSTGGAGLR